VLDGARKTPEVIGRANRVRGSELIADEQPIRANVRVSDLTDEDVLNWVLRVIVPLVER
jgi:hypothetical protein